MEEIENGVIEEKEEKPNRFVLYVVLGIVGVWLLIYGAVQLLMYLDNKNDERVKVQAALNEERISKNAYIHLTDSLKTINKSLSIYETLTLSIVYLKPDSIRGVVEDIVIGGGKYNFYVKYRVNISDSLKKEVIPELIY